MADGAGEVASTEAQDSGHWPLPEGWCWATLGELVPKPDSKLQPDPTSDLAFIGMDHVEEAGFRLLGQGKFAEMKSAASHFQSGDILYGRLRPYLNKVHQARFEGAASAEFIVLRPCGAIKPDLLKYLLHRQQFVNFAMERVSGDRPRTNYQAISKFRVPLPPAAEQVRIAEKIDTLFAQIEAGEAALAEARRNVARYRKAVLKAAVTGALTADWRAENTDALEDGEPLRTRLLAERRAAWERDQIAKANAKGKPLKGEAWKAKYKPPVEPDTDGLPDLPEGWVWMMLDEVASLITSGSRGWKKYYSSVGARFIRAQDINSGRLSSEPSAFVTLPKEEAEGQRTRVRSADLLVTITGANVTISARVKDLPAEAYVNQHVALVRPAITAQSPYLEVWLKAKNGGLGQLEASAYGAGKPGLSLANIQEIRIALPSSAEQAEVVARVEAALEEADRLDAQLNAQARASRALRQSVLKAAFEGRLVPQNLEDEPASALLERIKAERAAAKGRKRNAAL